MENHDNPRFGLRSHHHHRFTLLSGCDNIDLMNDCYQKHLTIIIDFRQSYNNVKLVEFINFFKKVYQIVENFLQTPSLAQFS